ncbi:MAG: polysaccharide deacetylase family protein [Phycisphaerales bacterium]|nr:polysaccharide deacetylase family protein [Phycisphaerales bacterium]MCB9862250.1 polysaccharide deacetylase family protein [Phycisphaerales bacterium]
MFERFFGKKKPPESAARQVEPTASAKDASASTDGLEVSEPTIGLCFNFMRGMAYDSESLSDAGLREVMATLAECELRATFFCSAKLCETSPDVIRSIANAGHEIAALGYADEAPNELDAAALTQLALSCRAAFGKLGIRVIGFRSPKSNWDQRLMAILPLHGYVYSAEHDHAYHPYWIKTDTKPVIRIPVRTDDRGLRRRGDTYDDVVSKHFRVLRKGLQRKCFVTVCFHPWILAESGDRMDHWRMWLEQVLQSGARVGALEDALPASVRGNGSTTAP